MTGHPATLLPAYIIRGLTILEQHFGPGVVETHATLIKYTSPRADKNAYVGLTHEVKEDLRTAGWKWWTYDDEDNTTGQGFFYLGPAME